MDFMTLTDEKLALKASLQLQAVEKKMANVDALHGEIVRRLDAQAGDDRTGPFAKYALQMRSIQEMIGGCARSIKGQHALLSVLWCNVAGQPMTRGGER